MESPLARLSCFSAEPRPSRRKFARSAVSAVAVLSGTGDEPAKVRLADVSVHGCAISGAVPWARPGRFVAIELDGDPPIQAIIRWARDEAAGLEFLRPVPSGYHGWHSLIASPWSG